MGNEQGMKAVSGGVLAARGFSAAGVRCGIKVVRGKPDVALLVAKRPAAVAAMFTKNQVKAAPVSWCQDVVRNRQRVRAVVVNSGCANACTGSRGDEDAAAMAAAVASLLGSQPDEVLVSSTGVIGRFLPMEKVRRGIGMAAGALADTPAAGRRFAQAIMTTDTRRKECAVETACGRKSFRIGGCAKGSGMIGPNLATMLVYITTDAAVESPVLRRALRRSVDRSFNCISVDGHTSTNDTILLLASGASGVAIRSARLIETFQSALDRVTLELAKSIVRDGEGATKLVRIDVTGARTQEDAAVIARTMSRSPLNLTAIHGGDPNWGRFVSSAGYAGPPVIPERMRLFINGVPAFHHGLPAPTPEDTLATEMRRTEIHLHLDLGLGRGSATVWTCDLSREYVTINADYHT